MQMQEQAKRQFAVRRLPKLSKPCLGLLRVPWQCMLHGQCRRAEWGEHWFDEATRRLLTRHCRLCPGDGQRGCRRGLPADARRCHDGVPLENQCGATPPTVTSSLQQDYATTVSPAARLRVNAPSREVVRTCCACLVTEVVVRGAGRYREHTRLGLRCGVHGAGPAFRRAQVPGVGLEDPRGHLPGALIGNTATGRWLRSCALSQI